MDLFDEFAYLSAKLQEEGIDYALCGGLAMAVYAFPRATLDIDIMVESETLEPVKELAHGLGFDLDAGLMEFAGGAVRIHRLTKIPPGSPDPLVLDIMLVTDAVRDAWESRRPVVWERGRLSVVSPAGLIQLKSMRQSGQDADDIEKLRSLLDEA